MFIIFKKRMGIFTTENFYNSDFKLNVKFDIELILNAIRISLNVFMLLVVLFYMFFFYKAMILCVSSWCFLDILLIFDGCVLSLYIQSSGFTRRSVFYYI